MYFKQAYRGLYHAVCTAGILRIGLHIAKGDLHGYIGKADHETITYIGSHRRLQLAICI